METNEKQPLEVYKAINAVQSAMQKEGISKGRKNQQQGYAFRGIDDCYAAVAPHLAEQQLCIIPRYMTRSVVEHESKSGSALFYVTVEGEFDFVSAIDGSKHTARMFGEAMDSADKATNKASSAAFKYLLLQTFCIPTEGDNDADLHTPEPMARRKSEQGQIQDNLPKARPGGSQSEETASDVMVEDMELADFNVEELKNKTTGKTYTLWQAKLVSDSGSELVAGTIKKEIGDKLEVLKGQVCTVKYKLGRYKGTYELLGIDLADEVPM